MHEIVRQGLGGISVNSSLVHDEVYPVAAVLCISLVLLTVKAKRARDQRRRKAASTGYHDFDVARYGVSAAGTSLIDATLTNAPPTLAPTFVAGQRSGRHLSRRRRERQVEPQLGAVVVAAGPLPAFDADEALRLRPPSAPAQTPLPATTPLPAPATGESALPPPPPPPVAGLPPLVSEAPGSPVAFDDLVVGSDDLVLGSDDLVSGAGTGTSPGLPLLLPPPPS